MAAKGPKPPEGGTESLTLALAGLSPHERVIARAAARALGRTQAEQVRGLGNHRDG